MASIRRRGSQWRAEVYKQGIRYSATHSTKAEATAWAAEKEYELNQRVNNKIIETTVEDFLDRYLSEVILDLIENKSSHRSRKNMLLAFKKNNPDILKKKVHLVTTEDLERYQNTRLKSGIKTSTYLRELTELRAAWKQANVWGYTIETPFKQLRLPKEPPPRTRIYSQEEIDEICAALFFDNKVENQRHETAICFLLSIETAMRSNEILTLRHDNIFLEKKYCHLPQTKNGDARDIPLSNRAVDLLKLMQGRHSEFVFSINESQRDYLFRSARDFTDIKGATFHDARATALTRLSKKLNVLELARMVGHRDPRSLMIYYRESASNIAKLLN